MKILFVCSGNSGRSPMAQFVMRDLVDKAGLGDKISVASAASKVVDADKLHAGIAAKLREENIPFGEHTAHTITPDDYASSDMIVCVDAKSAAQVKELIGDPDGKISTLLDTDIPWDKNGFAKTFDDIKRGCENLLTRLGG
ncbi:MAG: low molecular weight phosphotyrosine protein phosphatase [Selenomonadaceae bacterium]|nr:low molecular weight phosphotyrosine protein phosphatase [Selenomonadaceae bacterium]